jgi:hypothetical protein
MQPEARVGLDLGNRDPQRGVEAEHPRDEVLDRRGKIGHRVKALLHFVQKAADVRVIERQIPLV